MISVDENGPQLYHMDPSGTYLQFDAKAIGSGSEGAQQSLQEAYHKSITLKEATKTAFTILKQVGVIINRDIILPTLSELRHLVWTKACLFYNFITFAGDGGEVEWD